MLLFTSIWICNIMSTGSFILQDTYNVMLKRKADYKVDLVINADDYEMIDKNQLKDFNIDDKKHEFNELNKIASEEYNKTLKSKLKNINPPNDAVMPIVVVTSKHNKIMTTYMGPLTTHAITKRDTTHTTKENDTELYNYEYLMNEYYDEANDASRSNNAYHISKSVTDIPEYGAINSLKAIFLLRSDNNNCTEVKGIGLQAIKCLVEDYTNQRQSAKDAPAKLLRIVQIWFLVYLAVAVPLWCTRGWCCCCLCCKFFKPRQTIEEAKKYVVLCPPGIFKTKNGVVHYEPSERERECYEEFEHFIKTL